YIYKSSAQFFEFHGPIRGNCDLHQWRKSGNPFRETRRRRASRISTFLLAILTAFLKSDGLFSNKIRREQITAVISKSRIEILDSVEDLLANDRPQTRSSRTEIDKPPAATN
ncbi:hypothetical protein ALC56_11966, partial [Trachymyrmex septentrionalis]